MTPRTRNYYDTMIIYLIISGKDNLLPLDLINKIPSSTKSTWRTYSKDKFIGNEQQNILEEGIRKTELYQKYKHVKKVLQTVELIYTAVSDMLEFVKIPIYQIKENKNKIIDLIAQCKDVIGFHKLLKIFKLSVSTYQSWLLDLKVKCSSSFLSNASGNTERNF